MEESVKIAAAAGVDDASEMRDFQQQSLELIDKLVLHGVWGLVELCLRLL